MIEMMVVLTIIGILTGAVVGNYGSFRSATVATNVAYELAGSIRQAQLYGLGVRLYGQPGTVSDAGTPNDTYGVELTAGTPSYSIFRDKGTPNATCDSCSCGDSLNECVEQVTMLQQVTVEALCTGSAAMTGPELLAGSGNCVHTALSVMYTRPNPEALFYVGSGASRVPATGDTLAGVLVRGGTHCRLVRVYQNGQVAVESVPGSSAGPFASECGD